MAFDRKYTDDQREAIYRAWSQSDLSVTEISKRAKAGDLYELSAFNLPERSARDIISRRLMREVRQGIGAGGEEPLHLIVGRLITVADAEATRLVTQQGKGELDAKEFREFVRSIGDLMQLQKQATLRQPKNGEVEDEEVGGLAAELMAEAE